MTANNTQCGYPLFVTSAVRNTIIVTPDPTRVPSYSRTQQPSASELLEHLLDEVRQAETPPCGIHRVSSPLSGHHEELRGLLGVIQRRETDGMKNEAATPQPVYLVVELDPNDIPDMPLANAEQQALDDAAEYVTLYGMNDRMSDGTNAREGNTANGLDDTMDRIVAAITELRNVAPNASIARIAAGEAYREILDGSAAEIETTSIHESNETERIAPAWEVLCEIARRGPSVDVGVIVLLAHPVAKPLRDGLDGSNEERNKAVRRRWERWVSFATHFHVSTFWQLGDAPGYPCWTSIVKYEQTR